MTGTVMKKFQLVEVYYQFNKTKYNITCYVHDTFTQHITVKGVPEYIKENSSIPKELWNTLSDPASLETDHISISKGIGLILCTATINKLRDKKIVLLKGLSILLEPTIFDTAISGKVLS